jgi:hypothetical protein
MELVQFVLIYDKDGHSKIEKMLEFSLSATTFSSNFIGGRSVCASGYVVGSCEVEFFEVKICPQLNRLAFWENRSLFW